MEKLTLHFFMEITSDYNFKLEKVKILCRRLKYSTEGCKW